MPTLNLITNAPIFPKLSDQDSSPRIKLRLFVVVPADRGDASDIIATLSSLVATDIGKSEAYVLVSLRTDVSMCFGGTEAPCAFAELISIGGLTPDKNKKLSADICSALEMKLDIPKNRIYIKFFDVERPFLGYNGTTFG